MKIDAYACQHALRQMDETDAKITSTSTKLLGIVGQDIGGVTRKLFSDECVPIYSVVDLTTVSSSSIAGADGEAAMQRIRQHVLQQVNEDVENDDAAAAEHNHLHCISAQVKSILARLILPLLIVFTLTVITLLESLIRGSTLNTEALLKVVKSEMDSVLEANGAANHLLSSVNRSAVVGAV